MRQGQQNRRGRGRNNNNNQNRKGQNPLTRSFESTGPDVKIRGTPAHIAEKYMALARDAQSSGDPVLAENYLQHAEHYNRIIMAFREQQMAQGGGDMQNGMRPRPAFAEPVGLNDDFGDEDGDDLGSEMQPQVSFNQPQHRDQQAPRHHDNGQRYDDRGPRHEGGNRPYQNRDRHGGDRDRDRDRDRGFSDRQDRGDRGERFQRPERVDRGERPDRPDRTPQPDVGLEGGQPPPRRAERPAPQAVPHHEQPEFLRRPVRRPRREGNGAPAEDGASATPAVEGSSE
jgi:hypothetical protein